MHVDQAWGDKGVGRVERLGCVLSRTRCMDAGDQRPDDADIGVADLTRYHIDDLAACNQQVERQVAACRSDGTGAQLWNVEVGGFWRQVLAHRRASFTSAPRIIVRAFPTSISAA
jgi:hypothetical protein